MKMPYARSLIIAVLLSHTAVLTAAADGRQSLPDPTAVSRQKFTGRHVSKNASVIGATPLDRVAMAVDGAESSHGKDPGMWRPDPSGPQGPMQVGEAAATDVGGGNRFVRRRIVRWAERTWHSSTDGTRTGLTLLPHTIGALATSIPGSELGDRAKSCWLAWRYIRGESYTIADFATARRHRCFGDRRYLTSAPDSAQLWLIHLPIPHSPFSILTVVHSLGINDISAGLCPAAFLRRGCCA